MTPEQVLRKSVEPIALVAGTAARTLQEFLRDHLWDQDRMRNRLQQQVRAQRVYWLRGGQVTERTCWAASRPGRSS